MVGSGVSLVDRSCYRLVQRMCRLLKVVVLHAGPLDFIMIDGTKFVVVETSLSCGSFGGGCLCVAFLRLK